MFDCGWWASATCSCRDELFEGHLLVDGSYEEISYRTQQAGIYILVANKIIIQCTINERNKLHFLMYTDKQ